MGVAFTLKQSFNLRAKRGTEKLMAELDTEFGSADVFFLHWFQEVVFREFYFPQFVCEKPVKDLRGDELKGSRLGSLESARDRNWSGVSVASSL